MRRTTINPRVRRRLFEPDDTTDQARIDNFVNRQQELQDRKKIEDIRKWNFIFADEIPLKGDWIWSKENDIWIGEHKATKGTCEKEDSCYAPKLENESTPKSREQDEAPPALRKRRINAEMVTDKAIRRKIDF